MSEVNFVIERRLRDAARGDANAAYDLGVAWSIGTDGVEIDLIEAHQWFNLAAVWGDDRAAEARTEIADEMSAREIVEAQRRARARLAMTVRQAA
ncbi:Sel1 repeat family protein [Sphingomonas antarctica]|uniref:hypothetical protein n=1 Tax=Sphingomonas antarctica TaxID=2040274 RepID=UPI0039EABA90